MIVPVQTVACVVAIAGTAKLAAAAYSQWRNERQLMRALRLAVGAFGLES